MTDNPAFQARLSAHVSNAAYGAFDYLAYPLGMLLVAPVALRSLGVAQYGVWALATAAVSAGSIVASGFGDANIRAVALRRGQRDAAGILRTVRSSMSIHLVLGALMAAISILLAPVVAARVTATEPGLNGACAWSLRCAGFCMLVRAIETVCISTQRAFERYGAAVRVSLIARLLSLLAAAILPLEGFGVAGVMLTGAILTALGLALQMADLRRLLGTKSLAPSPGPASAGEIFRFGIFTWIQAVSGLLFTQVDRLATGIALGAATVASYALCAQLCAPIYGITAGAMHFLFPHLASRHVSQTMSEQRRTILLCLSANAVLVGAGVLVLLAFGRIILKAWVGEGVASSAGALLAPLAIGTAMAGLSVTGSYALLALGHVRVVTMTSLLAGVLMLLLTVTLLPRYGASGAAWARILSAPFTLLVYGPLFMIFRRAALQPRFKAAAGQWEEI